MAGILAMVACLLAPGHAAAAPAAASGPAAASAPAAPRPAAPSATTPAPGAGAAPAPAAGPPAAPAAGPGATPPPEPKPIPVANIPASAEAAEATLRGIEDALPMPSAIAAVADDLLPFAREFDAAMRASRAALSGRQPRGRIDDADADLQALQGRLGGWERMLTRRSEELEQRLAQLAQARRLWQVTEEQGQADELPRGVAQRIGDVQERIDAVRKRVQGAREALFTLQDRVSRFQARAGEQREALKQAKAMAVGGLLVRDAPPLWSEAARASGKQASLFQGIRDNVAAGYANAAEYVRGNQGRLALLPLIVAVFLAGLWLSRRQLRLRMDDEPGLAAAAWLFERPLAATLIATVLCSPWVLMYAPREINLILLAVALPPSILILRRVMDPRLAPFLYSLLVVYVASRLAETLDAVPTIERVLFQLLMVATLAVLGWLLHRHGALQREAARATARSVNWTIRGIRAALVGFAVALACDLSGFTQLARFIADAMFGAIYGAVILYAGVQMVYGLIRLALNLWPLQNLGMVRNHKALLEGRARRLVRWAAIAAWLAAVLDSASLLEPARDWMASFLAEPVTFGEIGISPGAVLIFIVTIWGAVLLSRLLRFVLDEDVFARLPLPRGIPYALTTILHYVLLFGAVLIAIVSTGINLDRFTIIAGAVGVGAGFGLQGIVNNFVSGLILLFERPIKVGDSVEMANRGGQIQHIGIRACVMRTGEGAEIIVPNSMLIASEVTNWTLSDRQRRIEIPVGVAYGNDPERVMALLGEIAASHEDVLPYPAPDALFSGFGPYALEFRLGAWTGRPERAGRIRSDLCVQIYQTLQREGIEIPYPQSTVHLRQEQARPMAMAGGWHADG
jgi:small-conductance mechanosensitive channel